MNWQMISALLTGAAMLCAAGLFAVRAIVRQTLDEKLETLDVKYASKPVTAERFGVHDRRIARLEASR